MGKLAAKQSAVAVMFARSPKETALGVVAGSASTPQADQLLLRNRVELTAAKESGAISAESSLAGNCTAKE